MHKPRSETHAESTIEEQRRLESAQAEKDFPPPSHHNTAPESSPAATTTDANGNGAAATAGIEKDSADISDEAAVNEKNGGGVYKRAKFKSIFRKSHDDESETPLDHTSSDLTLEERRKKALKRKIPVVQQFRAALFGSWINILLVFVPIGFALYYSHKVGPVPVFIVNFIAIIPLAAVLSYATEELAIRVGETFGGLLNATFG